MSKVKLLIEIPEELYKDVVEHVKDHYIGSDDVWIAVANGTPLTIPENPTNGDMIKALFPNGVISYGRTRIYYSYNSNGCFDFLKDWWDDEYKES